MYIWFNVIQIFVNRKYNQIGVGYICIIFNYIWL